MKYELAILGVKMPLFERPIAVEPVGVTERLGFIRQPGSTILRRAEWRDGRWVDHGKRPFDPAPVAWYSLVEASNV